MQKKSVSHNPRGKAKEKKTSRGNQFSNILPQSYTEENEKVLLKTPRSSAVKKQKLNSVETIKANKTPVIELKGIKREYRMDTGKSSKKGDAQEAVIVRALRGVDFCAVQGEFVSVMGPSGSGKSTLMNILGCLDKPSAGTYTLDGIETSTSDSNTFAYIRNRKIGFVFQSFNLLSRTTALENVELPLFYRRRLKNEERQTAQERKDRAVAALREVGLGARMDHFPSQLSGGQQQRVAIARAMVNDPAFILADEPTGNLDTGMTLEIIALFQDLNRRGKTIVMVTHEPELAAYTKRIITLRDGQLVSDKQVKDRRNAQEDLVEWNKRIHEHHE